jgi:glutathione S-transferase
MPILETSRGKVTSTDSILRFLAKSSKKMYGENTWERAEVDQWLEYLSVQVSLPVREIIAQGTQSERRNS